MKWSTMKKAALGVMAVAATGILGYGLTHGEGSEVAMFVGWLAVLVGVVYWWMKRK